MRNSLAVVVVGLLGCTPSSVDETPPVSPTQHEPEVNVEPDPEPVEEPKASTITVHMTAATLADDCGGVPNTRPRMKASKATMGMVKGDRSKAKRKAKRRCEQSSIQLAITAPADAAPADLAVKSVELLLESGKSVGELQARSPSVWTDADGYTPWNEKVEPSQDLSVSYALSQPDWSKVDDRWNQTFTVKAVLSIAGADQTLEADVTVAAPTSLPPGVKT